MLYIFILVSLWTFKIPLYSQGLAQCWPYFRYSENMVEGSISDLTIEIILWKCLSFRDHLPHLQDGKHTCVHSKIYNINVILSYHLNTHKFQTIIIWQIIIDAYNIPEVLLKNKPINCQRNYTQLCLDWPWCYMYDQYVAFRKKSQDFRLTEEDSISSF